jgi:hypothetical protein
MTTHSAPKRKRSGISFDRAYKIRIRLQQRVDTIMSCARAYRMTHEAITDKWVKDIRDSQEWKRSPEWVKSYIEGYWTAQKDTIYRYHLVWLLWLDGGLTSRHVVDTLTEVEKATGKDKEPNYRSPWARIDNDRSRHVWLDAQGNARADSPYDAKWKNEGSV